MLSSFAKSSYYDNNIWYQELIWKSLLWKLFAGVYKMQDFCYTKGKQSPTGGMNQDRKGDVTGLKLSWYMIMAKAMDLI